jgi:propionyl-CoA carboxylase alpha chain
VEHRLAVRLAADGVDVDGDGWAVALRRLPRFPDAATAVAVAVAVARWSRRCPAR